MRWQARRGVLNPLDAAPPGRVWLRAVDERLLREDAKTVALLGGLAGEPSSQAVRLWLEFRARPTGRAMTALGDTRSQGGARYRIEGDALSAGPSEAAPGSDDLRSCELTLVALLLSRDCERLAAARPRLGAGDRASNARKPFRRLPAENRRPLIGTLTDDPELRKTAS
jgi:hypothetical protein